MSDLIPLDLIQPNPYQPRTTTDQEHIITLAEPTSANVLLKILLTYNITYLEVLTLLPDAYRQLAVDAWLIGGSKLPMAINATLDTMSVCDPEQYALIQKQIEERGVATDAKA